MANYTVGIIIKADGQGVTGVFKTAEAAAKSLADRLNQLQPAGKRAANGIDETGNAAQRSTSKIRDMFGGLGTLKGLLLGSGFAIFAQQIYSATTALDGWRASLTSSTGSQSAAANELAFVRAEAERLGLVYRDLVPQYAALVAATRTSTLAGQGTRDIFTAIAEAGSALKLSQEQVGGALLAVQQIVSKGVVSQEELRGQLAERLPGAYGLAAKAMGVTEQALNKMIATGTVTADQLLPKLAIELRKFAAAGLELSQKSPAAELARLKNAYFDMLTAIGNSGTLEVAADVFRALRSVLETVPVQLARVATAVQTLGQYFSDLNASIGAVAGDGALAEWVNFALDALALLPANAKAAISLVFAEFDYLFKGVTTGWGLLGLVAQDYWVSLKRSAAETVAVIQIAWGALIDGLISKVAGFYAGLSVGLANIPGLGELSGQLNVYAVELQKTAVVEQSVAAALKNTTAEYDARLIAIGKEQAALVVSAQNKIRDVDAQRNAIFAERDAAVKLLATNKEAAAQLVVQSKAYTELGTNINNVAATKLNDEVNTKKLVQANQALAQIYQTLLQRLNPVEAIRNRAILQIAEINKLALVEGTNQELVKKAIEAVTRVRDLDLAAIEARKNPYDEMIKQMDRELKLAGLIGDARDELVRKYQAEDKAVQILNQAKQAGINLGAKTLQQLSEEIEARQIQIDTQQKVAEAAQTAADEYEQAWRQAFDAVLDDALKGGKNLSDIVRNYLRDIVAQFSKKIVLDVITRFSKQGDKSGKDGSSSDDEDPTGFQRTVQGFAGAVGVRDAYRNGGGLGGALSGAASGAALGSAILPGIGTIIGAIVGGLAGLFGGQKPADLRLGAQGVTRKPEQSFNTAFGAQQIGVRGGTDTAAFVGLVTDFDKNLEGIVASFQNGAVQLEAVKNRLRTWSIDLKGDAITAEAVLGSRFSAILSTFSSDIQTFVGSVGTTAERVQRLADAAFIENAAKASILSNTFTGLAAILAENAKRGETVAQTYERVSAATEILTAAMGLSGINLDLTRVQFIKFATDIAEAAGGTQAAAALWNSYFQTFFTAEERAQQAITQAQTVREAALKAIGLETTITAAQFRQQFEAALPTLTAEQVVQWLRAGQAIGNLTSAEEALTEVRSQGTAAAEAARQAEATALAAQLAAVAAYNDLSASIAQQLEQMNSTPFQNAISEIRRWETTQIAAFQNAARAAGMQAASETDLARVHILAAQRISQAIIALENTGRDRVGRLRQLLAGVAGGSASVNQSQLSGNSAVQSAVEDRYQRELDLLKSLSDYIDGLQFSAQSTLTPGQQLGAAQAGYEDLLRRANAGDLEALSQLQAASQQYLQSAQTFFGVSEAYDRIFASVNSSLQALVNAGPQNAPNTAVTGGGGGGRGGTLQLSLEEDPTIAQARAERIALVNEILDIAAQVIAVTHESLAEVALRMNTTALELITALGINVEDATVATVTQLAAVAQQLGIDLASLAADVGLELGTLNQQNSLLSQGLQAAVNTLPLAQRNQLQPLLAAITTATNEADANAAIATLEAAVNDLSPDLKNLLAPYLTGVNPVVVNQLTELQAIRSNTLTQAALLREIRDRLPSPRPPEPPAGTNAIISVASSNTANAATPTSTAQATARERELQTQLKANERAMREVVAILAKVSEQHAAQTRVLREVSEKVR